MFNSVIRILTAFSGVLLCTSASTQLQQARLISPGGTFVHIAGVYDQFVGIDFDSHVLSGSAAFSWLVKVNTKTGIATWATKVHSGTVSQDGADGPWVVADHDSGAIYASICAGTGGPGTVLSFYQAGSMTAVTTRTTTNGSHVYLVKYDKAGVLQWVRNTFYTVTAGLPDANKFMSANMPNLCMLPSGNVVLGASVRVGNSGNPDATTVKWTDGTTAVDAALLGEDGSVQGVLLEINPAGTFVSSKLSESQGGYAGGGSPNTPVILSPIANTNGFVVGHLRNYRAAIRLGLGEANEFSTGPIATYSGVNGYCAKYDTAKLLQWTAATVPINSGGAPIGPAGEPTSAWVDTAGNVYSADLLWGQTSQPDLRARVQSAGFSDTGKIDVAMPPALAGSGEGAPVYQKRDSTGLPVWARGFGPSSVFGDNLPRPITIMVVADVPWITGVVRKNAGELLVLDEGLASEVQLQGDSAPYPRAFLAKLNPTDGTITQMITFLGEAGQPGFGTDSGNHGDIRRVDAIFRGHPLGTSRLRQFGQPVGQGKFALIFDFAATRITIDGTNLDPIAPGMSFAPIAIVDANTGAIMLKKRYPTSLQDPASQVRAVSLSSAKQ